MSTVDKAAIIDSVETLARGKRQSMSALGQLLPVAAGAYGFKTPEKTVEPDHS